MARKHVRTASACKLNDLDNVTPLIYLQVVVSKLVNKHSYGIKGIVAILCCHLRRDLATIALARKWLGLEIPDSGTVRANPLETVQSQGWAFVAMSPNLATKTGQLEILATKRSNSGDNTRTQTLGSASRPRSLNLVSHPGISRARGTPCTRLARVIVNTYAWRDKLVSRPSLPLRMST